jgi:PAS domain S-box-containing protein
MIGRLNETARYEILQHADDLIAVYTPDGQRKFVNHSFCKFFETTSYQLVGKKYSDSPASRNNDLAHNLFISLTKDHPSITMTLRSGVDGREKWVSWNATGSFKDCGELNEVLLIGRVIHDVAGISRSKDLATLNAFRRAIDTHVICTITDAQGFITYANEKFCSVSGYSPIEAIGKTHSLVNSNYHTREFFEEMWQTITKGNMWKGQIKNKAKDGTLYWVESVIIPIKKTCGVITGYLSLRTLLTEEKKLEEERNAYLQSLEDMLFMVSHEIRKPITSCQGLLNLMQTQMPATQEEYDEAISHLMAAASEMDEYSRKLNEYLQKNIKIVQN